MIFFQYLLAIFQYLALTCYFAAMQHTISQHAEGQALTAADLYHGLKVVQPSAMKELAIEKPNVSCDISFLFDVR